MSVKARTEARTQVQFLNVGPSVSCCKDLKVQYRVSSLIRTNDKHDVVLCEVTEVDNTKDNMFRNVCNRILVSKTVPFLEQEKSIKREWRKSEVEFSSHFLPRFSNDREYFLAYRNEEGAVLGKSRKFRFCVESNEFAPVKVSTDHTDNVEMKSEKLATSTSSLEVSLHGKGGMRHEVPPEQRYSSGSLGKVWVQDYSTKYADTMQSQCLATVKAPKSNSRSRSMAIKYPPRKYLKLEDDCRQHQHSSNEKTAVMFEDLPSDSMMGMNNDDICLQELSQQKYTDAPIECSGQNSENLQAAPIPVIVSNSRSSFCCPEESENESVEAYKQHLRESYHIITLLLAYSIVLMDQIHRLQNEVFLGKQNPQEQENNIFKILISYYAKLCTTLTDIHTITPHLVSKNIITYEAEQQIFTYYKLPSEQVKMLLTHILGPVKAGIFSGLRGMLEIMEKYGNETTKQLAVEMNERLNKEDDYAEKHQVEDQQIEDDGLIRANETMSKLKSQSQQEGLQRGEQVIIKNKMIELEDCTNENLMGVKYEAIYDYITEQSDEVSFSKGDVIVDISFSKDFDKGWIKGVVKQSGEKGFIPLNYVRRSI